MNSDETTSEKLGMILAMLLLRIWLSMRAIQSGLEKYAGTAPSSKVVEIDGVANEYDLTEATTIKTYSIESYQGVPAPLYEKFTTEPLIPVWGLDLYNLILGPALIVLGVTLLLGLATRYTLFAMGLLYTSLTFGLILIKQDAGIAWLATHILLIVAALSLAKWNRFAILKKW
ncbi:MAG: hypothetical protein AAGJ81_01745 [Verrucomicrobiota bacterium]